MSSPRAHCIDLSSTWVWTHGERILHADSNCNALYGTAMGTVLSTMCRRRLFPCCRVGTNHTLPRCHLEEFPVHILTGTATIWSHGIDPVLMRKGEDMQTTVVRLEALDGFDEHIEGILREWVVPGLAVGIVKDGELVFAKGYGWRNLEANLPVTPNTIFAIGSNSKVFTATALGILVDEGKLGWERPIVEYLPEFRLHDPVATQHATVLDLLTHRIGLPGHELVWYGSPHSRRQLVERLRYLEPNKSFRARFEYSNLSYLTAGYLVEVLSGQSWEGFVRERIFEPLGMTSSNVSVNESQRAEDFSLPYDQKDGAPVPLPFRNIDTVGPAGSINSTVVDMARWLLLHLNRGKVGDRQIISETQLGVIQAPHIVPPTPPELGIRPQYAEVPVSAYGLGLGVAAYRGYKLLQHGGGIDGFISQSSFLPSEGLGVVVLSNQGKDNVAPPALIYHLYDRLLGLEPRPWSERMREETAKMREALRSGQESVARVENTSPSHDLDAYTGQYEHPGYGMLTITRDGEGLRLAMNAVDEPLAHRHYDVFDFEVPLYGIRFAATFLIGADGGIGSVSIPFQPGSSPIVFDRALTEGVRGSAS
jgi:CubicO group peptidase (beta-lactamase class C family)